MTNHVHLLLTPSDAAGPLTLMRRLGQNYVPYFNRRYGRTGTLWEGRFKSCLVDSAHYVLGCYRYIELHLVEPSRQQRLGLQAESRRSSYRGLFKSGDDPAFLKVIREATHGAYPLVGEALKAQLAKRSAAHLGAWQTGPEALWRRGIVVLTPNTN